MLYLYADKNGGPSYWQGDDVFASDASHVVTCAHDENIVETVQADHQTAAINSVVAAQRK